ncbi:ras-related protein Rab-13-like [Clavelina lepadiformis]
MAGGSSPKFRPRSSGSPSRPSEDEDIFKILLIGNSGVGKLALIYRFLYPDEPIFRLKFKSTVGLECETKLVKISGKTRQIQMWDIPGQKHFTSMTSYWFKGADGILLVYDVTDRQSFDDVPEHFVRIKQQADDDAKVILVGNKIDINDKRRVGKQEGLKFAKERGLKFFETSATGNINVADIFTTLVADILKERTSYLLEGNREGHKTSGKAVNCHVM